MNGFPTTNAALVRKKCIINSKIYHKSRCDVTYLSACSFPLNRSGVFCTMPKIHSRQEMSKIHANPKLGRFMVRMPERGTT